VRVSVSSSRTQSHHAPDSTSRIVAVTDNGRYSLSPRAHPVGFITSASDLIEGDPNGVDDVFVGPGLPRRAPR
jgi:hypothetical protein